MTHRRVAVTGIGVLCSIGTDFASFSSAVLAGKIGTIRLPEAMSARLQTKIACAMPDFDATAHFTTKQLIQLDRAAQFALVAAREALKQAGLEPQIADSGIDPTRVACVLGAAIGHGTFDETYASFYGAKSDRVQPLTLARVMPSAAASHVAMAHGLKGPVFATATACASANHAIGQAFHMVRSGQADLALTGGGDASLWTGVLKTWEALRVLSPDGCRPFSADRNGLVLGEGGAILVLEPMEHARARGATVLAEMVGFGMSADAGDLTAPDLDGASRAMEGALADAGIDGGAVGYVNAHGTGTKLNDKTETAALRRVLGSHLQDVPVSSTKSMVGHAVTAGGALELAATIAGFRAGLVPPTAGYRLADPECDIDVVPQAGRTMAAEYAISNAFAFGGLNATLVVRRM